MKNLTKILTMAGIVACSAFATKASAQQIATDNGDAHATVVTPISIAKAADMEFGNLAVDASGGTVVLPATGSRTTTGGVTLPSTTGTVNAASFTVSGQANYVYAITLPSSITITDGASHNMTINSVVSSPTVASGGTLSAGGTETLYVGGTLNVTGSQTPGTYNTTTPFDVSVVYN